MTITQYKSRTRFEANTDARMLNFACFGNQPFLASDRSRVWMCNAIARARDLHAFELWAFAIMPTHVHLLIFPQGPVPTILRSIKQTVSNRAVAFARKHQPRSLERMERHGSDGSLSYHFWQRGGGFDRNLWTPEHIFSAIDYIHMNPVRAKLCERPEEWSWSSAPQYTAIRDKVPAVESVLSIDIAHLPGDPR